MICFLLLPISISFCCNYCWLLYFSQFPFHFVIVLFFFFCWAKLLNYYTVKHTHPWTIAALRTRRSGNSLVRSLPKQVKLLKIHTKWLVESFNLWANISIKWQNFALVICHLQFVVGVVHVVVLPAAAVVSHWHVVPAAATQPKCMLQINLRIFILEFHLRPKSQFNNRYSLLAERIL